MSTFNNHPTHSSKLFMVRRIQTSAKKRKLQIQEERAIKKGLPLPHPDIDSTRTNSRYIKGTTKSPHPPTAARASLASKFIDLSPDFIQQSRTTSLTDALPRPLPSGSGSFPREWLDCGKGKAPLRVPTRPDWTYEMTKAEVEANEEAAHAKWLGECHAIVDEWKQEGDDQEAAGSSELVHLAWPRSATFWETNLQVWRQLWRTTEMSSIILVLLDIRCPPLHFPPSLQHYIASLQPQKQVILILTKCDLVPMSTKNAWVGWCKQEWGAKHGWEVVETKSFREKDWEQGTRGVRRSHIPPASLDALLSALERAHRRLLRISPEKASHPEQTARSPAAIRSCVDWDALRRGQAGDALDESSDEGEMQAPGRSSLPVHASGADSQPDSLSIGLIGQPNVGKSSLLNALVGSSKVRASKTPGKTKHFQTIFWSPEVRLCDTPGLIFPSFTTYELQAISTILPIAHIPAIPAVIRLAGCLMPLEKILDLPKVVDPEEVERERRKTYRAGTTREESSVRVERWTTGEILEGWAVERGFMTAQAGRPDINRAGNQILRLIAEGQIPWSFLPPSSSPPSADIIVSERGIWLGSRPDRPYLSQPSSGVDSASASTSHAADNSDESSENGRPDSVGAALDALAIEDPDSEEDDGRASS